MGRLTNALKKLAKRTMSQPLDTSVDDRDDFETRDKVLKGLRRQRRRQLDVLEKAALTKKIRDFDRKRDGSIITDKGILGEGKKLKKVKEQRFLDKTEFLK